MRRAADELAAVLAGRTAQRTRFWLPGLRKHESSLSNRRIRSVSCLGKAVLIDFAGNNTVYTHNQLYGRWYIEQRDERPETGRQLRLCIDTSRHSALLYSASSIEVLSPGELESHGYLSRLGPEALDENFSSTEMTRRLRDDSYRGRALAALYLDQRFLAGIGNYLRSEIFFIARIDPTLRPADLDRNAIARLARASLSVPRRSYQTGGITNSAANVRRLRSQGLSRGKYRFFVFGRDGRPCYRCNATIRRTELAGRRLYYCARCQE